MWEDDRNKLGGRWLITLSKQQRHNDLDRYWMETVSCVVPPPPIRSIFLLQGKALYLAYLSICLNVALSVCFAAVVFSWGVF